MAQYYRTAIFTRVRIGSVSPAVSFVWPGEVVDLLNQFPEDALNLGGLAEHACADFIAACAALPPIRLPTRRLRTGNWPRPLSVGNLPLRWDRFDQVTAECDTPEYEIQFRAWLSEELEWCYAHVKKRRELPVLISGDPPFHVTQGGEVLCHHLDRRFDRITPGQPLWVPGSSGRTEADFPDP
jgi:hypothetical protein